MTIGTRYGDRIGRALDLIERAAGTERWPQLGELAEAAAMSEFHFHRIYRLATGETPQHTVSRVRLGTSLPVLSLADGIEQATSKSAYGSSQSFARALKALTGATPSELRADPARFDEVVEAIARPVAADGAEIAVEIVELAPLRLVAVRRTGDYAGLAEGYHRLFDLLLAQIAPERITGLWGIPHADPRFAPAEACAFDCAVTIEGAVDLGSELRRLPVPGGPALRLRIPGDYAEVHDALDPLYAIAVALDLPLADILPVNFYHHDPENVPEHELVTDIHLMLA